MYSTLLCHDDDDDDDVAIGQPLSEPAVVDINNPQLTSYQLSGLEPGQIYRVMVCARTRVGCGQPYTVELHTPPAERTYFHRDLAFFDLPTYEISNVRSF